jgi:hypothetical protein
MPGHAMERGAAEARRNEVSRWFARREEVAVSVERSESAPVRAEAAASKGA